MAVEPPSRADGRSRDELDEAFAGIEREAPASLARAIAWMRKPKARVVRLPLGLLCIVASFLWFLPVLGVWLLPLGLLLIAQDVPFLRRPIGRMTLYLFDSWKRIRKWWANRKDSRAKSGKGKRTAT